IVCPLPPQIAFLPCLSYFQEQDKSSLAHWSRNPRPLVKRITLNDPQSSRQPQRKRRRIKTGGPRTLQRRNQQRKPQRNHQRRAHSNLLLYCSEDIYLRWSVCLEEIAAIANILKTAPASTVQLLHKIINDEPYSKSSRKEFKKFAGFPQNYVIEARKNKILKDFTKTERITVCTILGLNCAGSAKELSEHIFKNLSDLASLKNNFTEQLTDDEDEDSAPF
ncbi:hypothetical protein TNCV_2261351, partial [Trichonephila clavipes]